MCNFLIRALDTATAALERFERKKPGSETHFPPGAKPVVNPAKFNRAFRPECASQTKKTRWLKKTTQPLKECATLARSHFWRISLGIKCGLHRKEIQSSVFRTRFGSRTNEIRKPPRGTPAQAFPGRTRFGFPRRKAWHDSQEHPMQTPWVPPQAPAAWNPVSVPADEASSL